MLARKVFRSSLPVFACLILCLESSCVFWRSKRPKNQSGATSTPATTGQQPAGPGTPATGAPASRLVSRATVEEAGDAGSPSPGGQLIEHALAGGATARAAEATPVGGGNGVPLAAAERRVGVVRVIGAHGKFVLIETTTGLGGVPLGEGQELRCRGSAAAGGVETAVVKVSPERQAPYLVADVISGEPQMGDVAYFAVPGKQ